VWEAGFARLQRYIDRTGTAAVPSLYVEPDRFQLGQWVSTQRRLYNQGELSADRAERLASLPGWRWHTHREAWERGFDRLIRFYDEHGHVDVPKNYEDADGRLDLWVLHQREAYRRGGTKLSGKQKRRLAELPGWTWDPKEDAFADGLERLKRYALEQGRCACA
jgi:hypothetical protein